MSTSNLHYISAHGTTGWLVRVPYAYFNHSKTLRYKQKLFTFIKHGSSDEALAKAIEFRELNQMEGLEYNYRGATAGNGKQVRRKRVRGDDLPFGITDTLRYSRQGKEQRSITAQACCENIRRIKSFMYGHSRSREEAIVEAKAALALFLSEIEESIDTAP